MIRTSRKLPAPTLVVPPRTEVVDPFVEKRQIRAGQIARRMISEYGVVPPELNEQVVDLTANAVDYILEAMTDRVHGNSHISDERGRQIKMRTLLQTQTMSPLDRTVQLFLTSLSPGRRTVFGHRSGEMDGVHILKDFPIAPSINGTAIPVEVLRLEAVESGDVTYTIQDMTAIAEE